MMSTNAYDKSERPTQSRGEHKFVKYQSSPREDVRTVIVEPSFDAEDISAGRRSVLLPKLSNDTATHEGIEPVHSSQRSDHFLDATSPSNESVRGADFQGETRSGPTPTSSKEAASIAPALSMDAHSPSFNSANSRPRPHANGGDFPLQQTSAVPTSPSQGKSDSRMNPSEQDYARGSTQPYPRPQPSPLIGKKHRSIFSGGMESPVVARRRINSGGESVPINRQDSRGSHMRPSPRGHHRESSGGLEMLSAVANVSKDVLAEAAGALPPPTSSGGQRVDGFNLSPTSFSSISSASPSHCHSSNSWSNGPNNPSPPSSTYNERSHHPGQMQPRHPRYYHPDHRQHQQFYRYPPHPYSCYSAAPRVASSGPPGPYPTQYAPRYHHGSQHPQARRGAPSTSHHPPFSSRHDIRESVGSLDKVDTDESIFGCRGFTPQPPAGWSSDHVGSTAGVQTFDASMNVRGGNGTVRASAIHRNASASIDPSPVQSMPPAISPQKSGHLRKTSSFSSLGAFLGNTTLFPEVEDTSPRHQRWPSSTANDHEDGMEGLDNADKLLQQLSRSSTTQQVRRSKSSTPAPVPRQTQSSVPNEVSSQSSTAQGTGSRRYMMAGTSKRIRRKCNVAECTNRVVQGGVCISHGAKRKQCSHPGCTKHVKKAGLCSAHGPARKKCDYNNCTKVAVQGGKCIAHGAKKKLCVVESCSKQGILGGMCKRHHDQHNGIVSSRGGGRSIKNGDPKRTKGRSSSGRKATAPQFCVFVDGHSKGAPEQERLRSTPGHRRGLSVFADMSAVDSIIGEGDLAPSEPEALRGVMPPVASMSFEEGGEAFHLHGEYRMTGQWH